VGNFIGCAFIAWLFHRGECFKGHDQTIILAVQDKLSLTPEVVFIRGIFANWFVGIATWMSNCSLDMSGKAIAVFLPIFSFAALGFEHCIANQFELTMGCLQGADCTIGGIFQNLMIATVGNWVGAIVLMALPYAVVYGTPNWKMTKDRFY
jgi:formate/nitrite transporter FocA (FNT family)